MIFFELREMHKKKRKMRIKKKQLRRSKNLSFRVLSVGERKKVVEQERAAKTSSWKSIKEPLDMDSLEAIEGWHNIKFKPLLQNLRERFPGESIKVLDEGAGRSSLKHELTQPKFGGRLDVTTTDVRLGRGWPDKVVNVVDLVKEFGKNRFHLVVSTAAGGTYSPLGEKALFQIVSVLKPGGKGVVSTSLSNDKLASLSKRLNITIKKNYAGNILFTKNIGIKKKR